MGVRIIVEVLDHWQDYNLTASERFDLLVIAEVTSDRTRETRASLHTDYIRRRAGGKSPASWKNALTKLMKKGVLKHAVRNGREVIGYTGQAAQYQIPPMCPDGPHDGLWGQCTRSEGHQTDDPVTREGHQTDDPVTREGHQSDERGSSNRWGQGHQTDDPIPSYPSGPSSSSGDSTNTHASTAPPKTRKKNPGVLDHIATHLTDATQKEVSAVWEHIKAGALKNGITIGSPRAYIAPFNAEDLEHVLERVRTDQAAHAPRPRPGAGPKCTRHFLPLDCTACAADYKSTDPALRQDVIDRLTAEGRHTELVRLTGEPVS